MKLDHIGIVVRDIEQALNVYQVGLGLPLKDIMDIPDQEVKIAFLPLGESNIELVQPTASDSGTAKFLEKRGEGVHHLCIQVEDIEAALAQLESQGVPLIDQVPRKGAHGRVAFVHPKGAHGVLIELVEHEQ
jgi:methylmalonyl-CoA epimerase